MISKPGYNADLRRKALAILSRELTGIEYARFYAESGFGEGDYTAERRARLDAEEAEARATTPAGVEPTRSDRSDAQQPARVAS